MTHIPTISVIVPVYNVERYLDRCIESLLAQSVTDLEILLIDDGSSDGSGALCNVWSSRDSRIQTVHKTNGGLSSARNEGLRHATGQYVMFIDSDDVIHKDMCKHLLDGLQQHQAQIAACEPAHTFAGRQPPYTVKNDWLVLSRTDAIQKLWYQRGFFPSACTKLYCRELFADTLFCEGLLFEDVDIMHRLLWQTDKVVYTASALYGYMHRGNSITTKQFSVRDLDILIIADRLLAFAAEKDTALLGAARSYAVTAAMRVALNAPKTESLAEGRQKAKALLKHYGPGVLFDRHTRLKSKCGLLLYFLCRPLMRTLYKRIDRWK